MYKHAIVVLSSLVVLPALMVGCEEETKATPQVLFEGRLEGSNATCRDSGQLFRVGTFGNPNADPPQPSQPIKDGEPFEQGTASVGCSVIPAGADEFNVDATVTFTGATGGLFKVKGKVKTSGEQPGIDAIFSSRQSGNTYEQKAGCIIRYEGSNRGVAAGRIWGTIECPQAVNAGAQTECRAIAEFRFENCAQ